MGNQTRTSAKLDTRATHILAAAALAFALLAQPLQAQMPGMDIRIGVQTAEPTNNNDKHPG